MTPLTPLHVAAHQKLHFVDVVSDIILLKSVSSPKQSEQILYYIFLPCLPACLYVNLFVQGLKKSWSENLLSMQFSGHVSKVTTVQSYHQAVTLCCATLALLLLLTRTFPYKTKTLKGNIMFIMSKLHISRQPCYVVALHLLVDTFGQIEATWENEFFLANS